MSLYEKYHENTLDIIQENPYRLIYDIEGFGFKKTDELAMKLGFKIDNIERLKALLIFTMMNLSNQFGLTYLTKEQLLSSSYRYGLENSNINKKEQGASPYSFVVFLDWLVLATGLISTFSLSMYK